MTAAASKTSEGLIRRMWRSGPWAAGTGAAYEAWHAWPRTQGRRKLVHAAILAANAHDTQPWRFRMSGDTIAVFADLDRHLGSFDPFRREMHLSIGCALENLEQAAKAQGLDARIEMPPGRLHVAAQPNDPAAIVTLTPGDREETELFRAIPRRHTHRGAYRPDAEVAKPLLADIEALARDDPAVRLMLFTGARKQRLGELIVSATRAIIADRQMAEDNARWFRFHFDDVEEHRDGLTLDTNVVPPLANMAAKIFPPSAEAAGRRWVQDTRDIHVATAPLLGIVAVRDLYDRPTALRAGMLWQRIHLLLTARGLAAQPLNQPVERVDRERELGRPERTAAVLREIVDDADWQPTFIFRAGHASRPARLSPRRPIETVIVGPVLAA